MQSAPRASVPELYRLSDETLLLIETHLPSIDTRRTRDIIAMKLRR